jgi:predicted secreted hydrolase
LTPLAAPVHAMISRRDVLLAATTWPLTRTAQAEVVYASVTPRPLVFPRDHGAHPEYRTEWWYLTGWLDAAPAPIGFQVTFFRVRTSIEPNASRFSPQQLIIAHAAIADRSRGALLHDERVERVGFGLVEAALADTDVRLDRWRLARDPASGLYRTAIPARTFDLTLRARPTQPLLLQGREGFSQKGPLSEQASFYYSQPQLVVTATLRSGGRAQELSGVGWLDHEWSSSVLGMDARGWDWIGMNLADGAALTAFQIRSHEAGRVIHRYAALRSPGQAAELFSTDAVRFEPVATWQSPRTGATYPVAQRIRVGTRVFETRPLMNDQELDSRASTGAVYWEGASELTEGGRRVGRGYLEMTGYVAPMRL